MQPSDSRVLRPAEWLLDYVESGRTGRVTAESADGRFDVFLMNGEILAVHATDDGARLVELLQNRGAPRSHVDLVARRTAEGVGLSECLFEILPDTQVMPLLRERFRDNLVRVLARATAHAFTSMDAVFTDNIQVGHESRALLLELDVVADQLRAFDALADQIVHRAGEVPADHHAADVAGLCDGTRTVQGVLRRTPREGARVVVALRTLLDEGKVRLEAPSVGRPRAAASASAQSDATPDDEMAAFQDYDSVRSGGDFMTDRALLDRVEVTDGSAPAPAGDVQVVEVVLEMEEAERTAIEASRPVSLNFSGPKLQDTEAQRKLEVVNDVLAEVAVALDAQGGAGSGAARIQLIVEGSPAAFAPLFKGVDVSLDGRMARDTLLRNLKKRPAGEQRRLVNRALGDLIERALGAAGEALDDGALERMLERIAGYQKRLGM